MAPGDARSQRAGVWRGDPWPSMLGDVTCGEALNACRAEMYRCAECGLREGEEVFHFNKWKNRVGIDEKSAEKEQV